MIRILTDIDWFWQIVFLLSVVTLAAGTSMHAILYKRDHRAAVMWVAFIWFSPLIGAICYLILGVNRIQRRAADLRHEHPPLPGLPSGGGGAKQSVESSAPPGFETFGNLVSKIVRYPLLSGNEVWVLVNGDGAFPEMLRAIDGAKTSITLASYIFDFDPVGERFIAALERAAARGVDTRVLIDDVGAQYSRKPVSKILRAGGVNAAHFHPKFFLWRLQTRNLRNHRKVMVVDGIVAFTGGMNIRHGNCLMENPAHPIQDLHFRVQGPVVSELQHVFADDWNFSTGETLTGDVWFRKSEPAGKTTARVIPDGPDENFEKLPWTLHGAIACARESILIATPYFLPDRSLITALNIAALRGVTVDIFLPAKNNLPFVHWASQAMWWQVLEHGCRLWLTRGPFDHSKVMVVDGEWSLVGSANWDPRSLRLNFELNLEAYDRGLADRLTEMVRRKQEGATRATLEHLNGLGWLVRLRNGAARLFTPIL